MGSFIKKVVCKSAELAGTAVRVSKDAVRTAPEKAGRTARLVKDNFNKGYNK